MKLVTYHRSHRINSASFVTREWIPTDGTQNGSLRSERVAVVVFIRAIVPTAIVHALEVLLRPSVPQRIVRPQIGHIDRVRVLVQDGFGEFESEVLRRFVRQAELLGQWPTANCVQSREQWRQTRCSLHVFSHQLLTIPDPLSNQNNIT